MVLYNSPYALALLVGAMLFVGTGTVLQLVRLAGLASRLTDPEIATTIKRSLLGSGTGVVLVLLLWLALSTIVYREAYVEPPSITFPASEVRWSPATRSSEITRPIRLDAPPMHGRER